MTEPTPVDNTVDKPGQHGRDNAAEKKAEAAERKAKREADKAKREAAEREADKTTGEPDDADHEEPVKAPEGSEGETTPSPDVPVGAVVDQPSSGSTASAEVENGGQGGGDPVIPAEPEVVGTSESPKVAETDPVAEAETAKIEAQKASDDTPVAPFGQYS